MATEADRLDARKAMAYDILKILKKDPEKRYSVEEIEAIIDAILTEQ